MSLIVETKGTPVGAIVSLSSFRSLTVGQQQSWLSPYYIAFQNCTRGAGVEAMFLEPEEKVAMVYAYQSEYGTNNGGRAEQLWHVIKRNWAQGHRMGSYGSGTPGDLCSLQAADLFAYELSHEFENRIKRPNDPMRWGLRQIVGMYKFPDPRINLYDRKELLRSIRDSHFPDQTGVEEVSNDQLFSTQESMMKWLVERGQFRFPEGRREEFIDVAKAIIELSERMPTRRKF